MAFPQTYVTGPCFIFVGIGDVTFAETYTKFTTVADNYSPTTEPITVESVGTRSVSVPSNRPILLGTCEFGPKIIKRPSFRPWHTSRRGDVPADMIFTGEDAMVFCPLNWYAEAVYAKLCARPFRTGTRGRGERGAIGTLMMEEDQTYRLWVTFPYASKTTAAGTTATARTFSPVAATGVFATMKDMPGGYRYQEAYLFGPDQLDPLGTQARTVGLAFHALLERETAGSAGYERLYDHDMSELIGYQFT